MSGAELSSIGSVLDDLTRRISALAEEAMGTDTDWMAQDLFEVERSLGRARRRLAGSIDRLSRQRPGTPRGPGPPPPHPDRD